MREIFYVKENPNAEISCSCKSSFSPKDYVLWFYTFFNYYSFVFFLIKKPFIKYDLKLIFIKIERFRQKFPLLLFSQAEFLSSTSPYGHDFLRLNILYQFNGVRNKFFRNLNTFNKLIPETWKMSSLWGENWYVLFYEPRFPQKTIERFEFNKIWILFGI